MILKKLNIFSVVVCIALSTAFCSAIDTVIPDVEFLPTPNGIVTGLVFSEKYTNCYGTHDRIMRAATLLTPDWIVSTIYPHELESDFATKGLKVLFRDQMGHSYISEIDHWKFEILPPKVKEYRLAFGRLKTPVKSPTQESPSGIAPAIIDSTPKEKLVGKIATLVGFSSRITISDPALLEKPDGVIISKTAEEGFSMYNVLSSEEVEGLLNRNNVAVLLRLESFSEIAKRVNVLILIDRSLNRIDFAEGKSVFDLSFPFDLELEQFPNVRKDLKAKFSDFLRNRKYQNHLANAPVLCSMATYPTVAGKEIFSNNMGASVTIPEMIEGEGYPNSSDGGAGAYIINEQGGYVLCGIVLCANGEELVNKGSDPLGFLKHSEIVPASRVRALFYELCLGKPYDAFEDEYKKAKEQRRGRGAQRRRQKALEKEQQLKDNAVEKEKYKGEEPEADVEDAVSPKNEKSKESEDESKIERASSAEKEEQPRVERMLSEEEEEAEIAQGLWTKVLGVKHLNSLTGKLKNTSWSGLVTKQACNDQPYKEIYTFHLDPNGTCNHYVSLLKYRSLLADHTSKGKWKVVERKGDCILKVRVDTNPLELKDKVESLTFCFDIYAKGRGIELLERDNSPNLLNYKNANSG